MTKLKTCITLFFLFLGKANAQQKATDTIDRFVQKFMQHSQIPGCAIAILKDNTVVKLKGYGLASVEFNAPVTTKTKFLLDSQTKLFTAIAFMKLQEQEKIKLDDPISKYLDSIPAAWHSVTIRNLLTHSSDIHDSYVTGYNDDVSLMEYTREQLYHRAIIGIVFLPNRQHFFISVFVTNSNEDAGTNEKIIADISKATWDYFTGKTK